MKKVALFLILFSTATSFSQSSSDELKSGARVNADKPTVYLEYACQDKKKVYLRMYNNTIWHISVVTDELYPPKTPIKLRNGINTYAAPNDKEISLQYRVEKWAVPWENVKVPQIAYPDNGFSNWIASQDSILFSVPIEYLRKDLQIFVRFDYEWEVTKKGYTISDPEHRVSFRGIDFSDTKPLACEKH
jgi:hypothetical protein